jgi:hypothetical protein
LKTKKTTSGPTTPTKGMLMWLSVAHSFSSLGDSGGWLVTGG